MTLEEVLHLASSELPFGRELRIEVRQGRCIVWLIDVEANEVIHDIGVGDLLRRFIDNALKKAGL